MKVTAKIVKELVQGFVPSSTVSNVLDNLDGTFTINVCRVYHARVNSLIKVNNVQYNVISFTENTITYKSTVAPSIGDKYEPPVIKFFNGTPFAVGAELSNITNFREKLPLFYLYEILSDDFIGDVNSSIDRESDMRWFILDEAQFDNWDTEKHYSNTIEPMVRYWEAFLEYLRKHKSIGLIPNHKLVYHAKFGISINQNGHVKQLFPDELSGIEININLAIKKSQDCILC